MEDCSAKIDSEKDNTVESNTDNQPGSEYRAHLSRWLNKQMKIEMIDGRILIGTFVCTDNAANIILGSCVELYDKEKTGVSGEPRTLGLVMVPGRHVVSIYHDESRSVDINIRIL